jgi:hypothetical protein
MTWLAVQGATPALDCPAIEEARAGEHVTLRCLPRRGVPAVTVLLFFRQAGREQFQPAPTLKHADGSYVAELCPHVLRPGPLHYYFEARDASDRIVARSGDEESPSVAIIRAAPALTEAKAVVRRQSTAAAAADDDPLAALRAQRAAEADARRESVHRHAGSVFAGLGAGIGHGWYPHRSLDFRRDLEVSAGSGAAGTVVLSPEAGYQLTGRLALSLQARWELIASQGAGDLRAGAPASSAFALLARAAYVWGGERAQLFLSAVAGAGDGFRLVVPQVQDAKVDLVRNDSVRGGPVVGGPGVGFTYHFDPHLALVAELRVLGGLPDLALVVDVTSGLTVAF